MMSYISGFQLLPCDKKCFRGHSASGSSETSQYGTLAVLMVAWDTKESRN